MVDQFHVRPWGSRPTVNGYGGTTLYAYRARLQDRVHAAKVWTDMRDYDVNGEIAAARGVSVSVEETSDTHTRTQRVSDWALILRLASNNSMAVEWVGGEIRMSHVSATNAAAQTKTRSWTEMRDSDVVAEIAAERGLTSDVEATDIVRGVITQHDETDANFLHRIAQRNEFSVYLRGESLRFVRGGGRPGRPAGTLSRAPRLKKMVSVVTPVDRLQKRVRVHWAPGPTQYTRSEGLATKRSSLSSKSTTLTTSKISVDRRPSQVGPASATPPSMLQESVVATQIARSIDRRAEVAE